MKIVLLKHARSAPLNGLIRRQQWIEDRIRSIEEFPETKHLPSEVEYLGSKGTVLSPPGQAAIATARRCFPDRRIEVDRQYQDPQPGLFSTSTLRAPSFFWQWQYTWHQLLGAEAEENPHLLKRQVVEISAKLIELAKKDGDSVFVGQDLLLRLVYLKLTSIGFVGPIWPRFKAGQPVTLRYKSPSTEKTN